MASHFRTCLSHLWRHNCFRWPCLELATNRAHRHREFEPVPSGLWFQL